MDNDGKGDLLIGAISNDAGGVSAGKTYLWLSPYGSGEPFASRYDAATTAWGTATSLSPANAGSCPDLYVLAADDVGNAIATFNCGSGNNVAHYSFVSDTWWGQQDIGLLGTGLSMSPTGDAVATGTTDTTAQANVFR